MTEEQKSFEKIWLPTLTAFTRWVMDSARKQGVGRLYFLARDAYFPYLIAQKLYENNNSTDFPEIRYLEGSRYSFRKAEFALPDTTDRDIIDKLCVGGIDVTLRKIFLRGGLTTEEGDALAARLGLSDRIDSVLTYRQTQALKAPFLEDRTFAELVRKHSRNSLKVTQDYLRQEGLYDDIPTALVDSGWVGSMQQTLCRLTGRHLTGYYFGLYELPGGVRALDYSSYAFAPWTDIGIKTRFSNCLFEALCSSPQGMTIGYKSDAATGSVVPIYEKETNPNAKRIEANESVIRGTDFPLFGQESSTEESSSAETLQSALQPLFHLMSRPTAEEAALYGTYLFSDDVNSQALKEVASGRGMDSAWPEGAMVRTEKGFRQKIGLSAVALRKRLTYVRKAVRHRSVYR